MKKIIHNKILISTKLPNHILETWVSKRYTLHLKGFIVQSTEYLVQSTEYKVQSKDATVNEVQSTAKKSKSMSIK